MNKAISKDIFTNHTHWCFTLFPYQIAFGLSIGKFEGFRLRLYFLFFKLALNIKYD